MKQSLSLILALLLFNCKSDNSVPDCSAVSCMAFNLYIQIINSETNSNYIVSNNLVKNDIGVKNANNEPIDFHLISETSSSLNGSIGYFASTSNQQKISIKNLNDISISYTISPPQTNECCDFGSIENVTATSDYAFDFDEDLRILTIYI